MLHKYKVGSLYNPTVKRWPEAIQYQYRGGHHELVLFLASPSPKEIASVRQGAAEFGVFVSGDVIFLLYRFADAISWSDAPFSIHLVPAAERELPTVALTGEQRAILEVTLVESNTGIIEGLRAVSLSNEFTLAIHEAILAQAASPWDRQSYNEQLNAIYARYPDSKSMLAAAAATTKGGA